MAVYGIGAVIKFIEFLGELEKEQMAAESVVSPPRVDTGRSGLDMGRLAGLLGEQSPGTSSGSKRPPTAYNKRYAKEFRKIADKYKKKKRFLEKRRLW